MDTTVHYFSLKVSSDQYKYSVSFYCYPWLRHIVRGDNDCHVKEASVIYHSRISVPGNNLYFAPFIIQSLSEKEANDCMNHLQNYLDEVSLDWHLW